MIAAADAATIVCFLLVDNYDSFTFNLRHALEALGEEVEVARNDALDPAAIDAKNPEILVISRAPAPRRGRSLDRGDRGLARAPSDPWCLPRAPGARRGARRAGARARELVHGKARAIRHDGRGLSLGFRTRRSWRDTTRSSSTKRRSRAISP